MYLALLRLGKMPFLDHYPKFALDLLGWAFSIGIVIYVITATLRSKRNTIEKPTVTPSPMGSIPTHLLQGKGARIGKTALAVILGVAIGWIWKAHQDHSIYLQEHESWQQRNANWDKEHASYQQAVAAWKAKQKENR